MTQHQVNTIRSAQRYADECRVLHDRLEAINKTSREADGMATKVILQFFDDHPEIESRSILLDGIVYTIEDWGLARFKPEKIEED